MKHEHWTLRDILTEVFLWSFSFIMLIALAILLWIVLPITLLLRAFG